MPRANRHMLPGYCYHLTHRCHNRDFLLKFAKDRDTYKGGSPRTTTGASAGLVDFGKAVTTRPQLKPDGTCGAASSTLI